MPASPSALSCGPPPAVAGKAISPLAGGLQVLQQFQKLLLAHPHIAHYLHQYSLAELFSGMHGSYCAFAIRMLHEEVASFLSC